MAINPKYYVALAFAAGILVTLGFKDFYPDLERRYRRRRRSYKERIADSPNNEKTEYRKSFRGIQLQRWSVVNTDGAELEGIESCIGNTPLLRIKSLSDATGCEILAKAEVRVMKWLVSILIKDSS